VGVAISNIVSNETCYESYDGSLFVAGPNTAGFTHELTLNGTPIHNSVVSGIDTLIEGLTAGNYVSVVRINGIPVDSSDIVITGGAPLIADFYADFNNILEGDTVNFFDNSTNAYNYSWNFGDGDTSNVGGSVMHQYTVAGNYVVTLTIVDENGCTASNFDNIDVQPGATSAGNGHGHGSMGDIGANNPQGVTALEAFRNTTRFTVNNSRLMIDLSEETSSTVTIVSANGTVVANEKQNESVASYELPAAGAYVVTIVSANGTINSTTIFAQ
jgi:PKD repeat protein